MDHILGVFYVKSTRGAMPAKSHEDLGGVST